MLIFEEKIIDYLKKHSLPIFIGAITLLAMWVRFKARGFISADMTGYLLPWYEEIKQGGLSSLGTQVGTYNIPYQTLIALMTYVNVKPVYLYKGFSILFDFLLAAATALCVRKMGGLRSGMQAAIAYALVLFLPTVVLNSSFWGQCDGIYTFFVLVCLYMLLCEREKAAYVFLGIALAFKLQAILILPFLLIYYVVEKRHSILNLLISVAVFYVFCLPGVIARRSIWEPFQLYMDQGEAWAELYKNFPSFLVFFGNSREAYQAIAGVMSAVIAAALGMELLYVLHSKIALYRTKYFFPVAAWTVWTCVLLLPMMHERYAYLLDILLIVSVLSYRRYLWAAVPAFLSGVVTYSCYLFRVDYDLSALSVVYTAAWVVFHYLIVQQIRTGHGSEDYEKGGDKLSV